MKRIYTLLAFLLLLGILPVSASSILVQVVGPDNTSVSDITVKALNGTTTLATGTTNATGWVELDVPNGTMVIIAEFNTTTDAITIITVSAPNDTFVVNMSELYWVKVFSTLIKANVTVEEPNSETELRYVANETILYTDAQLNYTFPKEVSKFPYKYVLKEIKYDGSSTTEPYLVLKPTSNTEVTAVYERQWWIALTTEQLIIVLIASVAIIMLLLAVTRGGAKAVLEHKRKYWT